MMKILKWKNIYKKFLVFQIIAFELVPCKFQILEREFLSSAINVLATSCKSLNVTNIEVFQVIFPQSNETI